nr:MAG TPA: hypothetical protein [Caudoviricetes sp.]DAW94714.1 MAG TPA: hypothetical protein [Bacteriophage sp.]
MYRGIESRTGSERKRLYQYTNEHLPDWKRTTLRLRSAKRLRRNLPAPLGIAGQSLKNTSKP